MTSPRDDASRGAHAGDADDEGGIDFERVKQLASFFYRAPRRRPKLAVGAFVGVATLTVLVALFWPRTYEADVRILAQANLVLPALGNPNRMIPRDVENLTRNVGDTILQRDNMVALAKQLDLVDRFESTRPAALRLKDKIVAALSAPPTEEDRLLGVVYTLDQRLHVLTDGSSITISAEWGNAEIAYEIVDTVRKNFVEARYDSDIGVINEAIRILEDRSKEESANVDAALAELTKVQAASRDQAAAASAPAAPQAPATPIAAQRAPVRRTPPPAPAAPSAPPSITSSIDAASANADAKDLEDVRSRIRELEDERKRRLQEAQNQLSDARVTLGPMHPTVVALSEKIERLSEPSPALATLKGQERDLVARIAAEVPAQAGGSSPDAPYGGGGGGGGAGGGGGGQPLAASPARPAPLFAPNNADDPATLLARAKLQAATQKYSDLLARIDAAKIELDVAQSSFKYKYTIIRPAELPRKPKKPNVPLVVIGGFFLAFLLAFGLSGMRDLAAGRFVEPWQIEHDLKIRVLGTLSLPPPRT